MRDNSGRDKIYPGMPFNQQMSFPRELSLRTTGNGIRLFARPAREIENLRVRALQMTNTPIKSETNLSPEVEGELFDIDVELEPGTAEAFELNIRGESIRYDVTKGALSCKGKSVDVAPTDDRVGLRVLVDRTSLELFAGDGRYVMSFCFVPDPHAKAVTLTAEGGTARIRALEIWQLQSIWE